MVIYRVHPYPVENPPFYAFSPLSDMPTTAKTATVSNPPTRISKLAASMAKLGLRSDMDFVLHLPMRYVDETEIASIQQATFSGGQMMQVEGIVTACDVQYRPRRQLVVTMADDTGQITLRFLNFYGSQITQLATGTRVRARGEMRHGFFGLELVHPEYKVVNENTPLPTQLTPVYHGGVGVSQAVLRL